MFWKNYNFAWILAPIKKYRFLEYPLIMKPNLVKKNGMGC